MTDFEMLQAILDEIKDVKQEVNTVNTRLDNLEQDNKTIRAKLDNLENKVDKLEKEVKQNTITLETTVKQCIDTIGEGYQANFEKIDRMPIESIQSKITQLELLYKFHTSEIERLKLKIS